MTPLSLSAAFLPSTCNNDDLGSTGSVPRNLCNRNFIHFAVSRRGEVVERKCVDMESECLIHVIIYHHQLETFE